MTFKYRPEVKSIEDLQPGDEFLVGDEWWRYDVGCHTGIHLQTGIWTYDRDVTVALIRANVPIERDIPYPDGGAEKWELREGDPCDRSVRFEDKRTLFWLDGEWINANETWRAPLTVYGVYAIPKAKPQDKAKPAPKEYTVSRTSGGSTQQVAGVIFTGTDFKPGDRVTVQRVEK
jgi:hypothetical protein